MRNDGIPATFQVAAHTITVATVPKSKWKHGKDCVGIWLPDQYRIEILGTLKGSNRQQVFVHEMMHCLCDIAGYNELSGDEVFIDSIAHLLAQALCTFAPSNYDKHTTKKSKL